MFRFLLVVFCALFSLGSFTQDLDFVIGNKFLKGYRAPQFKLKQFNIGVNSFVQNGYNGYSKKWFNQMKLSYTVFANRNKYQGQHEILIKPQFYSVRLGSNNKSSGVIGQFSIKTSNRFYLKEKWYLTTGGKSNFHYSTQKSGSKIGGFVFAELIPFLGMGNGRLEPVQFALKAKEIERLLWNDNLIKETVSVDQVISLSDELTRISAMPFITNKERRRACYGVMKDILGEGLSLKNEYELTEGMVDAFLYARSFNRFKGFRKEIGLVGRVYEARIQSVQSQQWAAAFSNYQYAAFFKLDYELPLSNRFQHSFQIAGMRGEKYVRNSGGPIQLYPFSDRLIGKYKLGFYPTAKLNLNFEGAVSALMELNIPAKFSVGASGVYFITPQFSFNYRMSTVFAENDFFEHDYGAFLPGVYLYDQQYYFELGLKYSLF